MANKTILFIFLILMLSQACDHRQKISAPIVDQTQNYVISTDSLVANYLKIFLSDATNSEKSEESIQLNFCQAVYKFYSQRKFLPVWTNEEGLNANADTALFLISDAAQYGLSSNYYGFNHLKRITQLLSQSKRDDFYYKDKARFEILLTDALMLFIRHLHKGRLNPETLKPDVSTSGFDNSLPEMLQQAIKSENFKNEILSFQPDGKFYNWLLRAYQRFLKTYEPDSTTILIPDQKETPLLFNETIAKILIANDYLSPSSDSLHSSSSWANKITEALKQFQYAHGLEPDGRAGINTIHALSKNKTDRYRQIIINLERLRWEKEFPVEYVFVNIPSYQLQIINKNEIIRTHRIIVGKSKNPTPLLDSKIIYFIVSPEWYVPFNIATKEILPKLKKDPAYLVDYNYDLFDKNSNLVDAELIDWSKVSRKNFNYIIRQSAGDENALGAIKFIFPNSYSVYLHDTPSRKLFRRDMRALSHGCIRLKDPLLFADFLLQRDSIEVSPDSLQILITNGIKQQINLKHPLPIYIRYFTCMADSETLFFYQDIYKKDKELVKAFFSE